MYQLTNNEGKRVDISAALYHELEKAFNNGDWSVIAKVRNETHIFILPDNFSNVIK